MFQGTQGYGSRNVCVLFYVSEPHGTFIGPYFSSQPITWHALILHESRLLFTTSSFDITSQHHQHIRKKKHNLLDRVYMGEHKTFKTPFFVRFLKIESLPQNDRRAYPLRPQTSVNCFICIICPTSNVNKMNSN